MLLIGSLWHEDRWLPCTERHPYAIKNQRRARNTSLGVFFFSKPLVEGFGLDELVLYGIRELAKQFLRPFLDTEVENSDLS